MMPEVERRFGPPSPRDLDSNGAGLFDFFGLRFGCGLEVALWRFHLRPDLPDFDPIRDPSTFEIHASQRDVEHIAFHLGVAATDLSRWYEPDGRPIAAPQPHRFHVVRTDDNANEFLVTTATSACEAEAIAGEYERRGHKQTYRVETR